MLFYQHILNPSWVIIIFCKSIPKCMLPVCRTPCIKFNCKLWHDLPTSEHVSGLACIICFNILNLHVHSVLFVVECCYISVHVFVYNVPFFALGDMVYRLTHGNWLHCVPSEWYSRTNLSAKGGTPEEQSTWLTYVEDVFLRALWAPGLTSCKISYVISLKHIIILDFIVLGQKNTPKIFHMFVHTVKPLI